MRVEQLDILGSRGSVTPTGGGLHQYKDNPRFNTSITRVRNLITSTIASAREKAHLEGEGTLIQSVTTLSKYVDACNSNGEYVLDLETTGINPFQDEIVGVCLYTPGETPAYVPINHTDLELNRVEGQLPESVVKEQLARLSSKCINHNMKFDQKFLLCRWGFGYSDLYWDTLVASKLLNENEQSHELKVLWGKYIGHTKDYQKFSDLFGKKVPFNFVPISIAGIYGANDGLKTYQLYQFQKPYLDISSSRKDLSDVAKLFRDIEMPLIPIVADMELRGVEVDIEKGKELELQYSALVGQAKSILDSVTDKLQSKINSSEELVRLCKPDPLNPSKLVINYNSSIQKATLLYDILKFPVVVRNKPRTTGKDAMDMWGEMELSPIQEEFLTAFKQWGKCHKLLNDFIQKIPRAIEPKTHAVHTNFNQLGTATGRFSSSHEEYKMNLQQIPSHKPHNVIRNMFKAREGYCFVGADYS